MNENTQILDALAAKPLTGSHVEGSTSTAFQNNYIQIEMVPSRYGPFTTVKQLGGAAVVVVKDGAVALVRQPRYAVGMDLWEIPRGGSNPEEPRVSTAVREVAEEVGPLLEEGDLVHLGDVHPDSGISTCVAGLYFADVTGSEYWVEVQQGEIDEVQWFPIDQVWSAVVDGTLTDMFTVGAVLRAGLRGLLGPVATAH